MQVLATMGKESLESFGVTSKSPIINAPSLVS